MKRRVANRTPSPQRTTDRPARSRGGFTLVEVLIVVVIVAIVSSAIVVQLNFNSRHAQLATLRYNEATLNQLISVYENDHYGSTPEVKNETLPQLLAHTNAMGNIGAAGASFPFGPYMVDGQMPLNFRTDSRVVTEISEYPPSAYKGGGWLFHRASGRIVADHKPGNAFKALVGLPQIDGLTARKIP